MVDLDGNRLLDFTGNHSVLIHGYLEPAVMDAIRRQLEKGTCFPGPTDPQLRLARHLVERIASLERVRFTNSGTEAVMMALRGARTFTGRRMVAKLEGGFHGTSEDVMGAARPGLVLLPAGDAEAAARILEQRAEEIAALLVEPVQGSAGMIPMDAAFLRAMRETTRRLGIVLVFDEVVSLRVAYGGAEEHYGIAPDMTCLGKLIGGGLPARRVRRAGGHHGAVRSVARPAGHSASRQLQRQSGEPRGGARDAGAAHPGHDRAAQPEGRAAARRS